MFDAMGNISLSLQVAILFLLILGLPLAKRVGGKKNLMRHGYLTVVALILHTILIFWAVVPGFLDGLPDIASLPMLSAIDVWSHIIFGVLAEVLGIIIIVFWVSKPLTLVNCAKMKKMDATPVYFWMISLVNGTLIHILGLL